MKPLVQRILERTDLILALAIILPLLIAVDVSYLKFMIEVGLGIVMYFSLRPFLGEKFHHHKSITSLIAPLLINYVILSGLYIIAAYLFFGVSHEFFRGYLLLAIVPPAVSIIPFCYIAKCDSETADVPVFIAFILALFIIPISLFLLFGKGVGGWTLGRIIVTIMIIPMLLAYKTYKHRWKVFDYGKAITNVCLAIIVFVSIAMNRSVFFDLSNKAVIYVYIINILVIFIMGIAVYFLSRLFRSDDAVAYSFYATQKNVGTSITLAIFLFNPNTAVPAIIALAVQFVYFIVFEELVVKRAKKA